MNIEHELEKTIFFEIIKHIDVDKIKYKIAMIYGISQYYKMGQGFINYFN